MTSQPMNNTLTYLLSLFLIISSTAAAQTQIAPRDGEFTIDLQTGVVPGTSLQWGPLARAADHATVAMNDDGDILVVYHSNRNDFLPALPSMLQIELAYFEFNQGATPALDTWEMISQQLVGSIEYSPLPYNQVFVQCERPDVVTDGDQFFVAWTRRYNPDIDPLQEESPAIIECAIVEKSGSTVLVHNDSLIAPTNPYGLGHQLTQEFAARDCLGVADAVVLKQSAGNDPKFGVIYPSQTDFADIDTPPDTTREFDLNLVTCSIDSSDLLTTDGPFTLQSGVKFNGPTLPGGGTAQGLILPDAAPTDTINDFWMTFETQVVHPQSQNIVGGVRLMYIKYDSVTGWNVDATKNFVTNNPPSLFLNRRPHISSLPGVSSNEEVSIVFNYVPSQAGAAIADVFCEQWEYSGGGLQRLVAQAFPNDPNESDGKPTILHGPANPLLRQCYFGRSNALTNSGGIFYHDSQASSVVKDSQSSTADRPATAYQLLGTEHTVALTWEDELYSSGGVDYKRVVLKPKTP